MRAGGEPARGAERRLTAEPASSRGPGHQRKETDSILGAWGATASLHKVGE